jgi:anti-sigma regulatory factor (Ser/Thr protein kinase)/serine/threonine protein phosphatase PrpC
MDEESPSVEQLLVYKVLRTMDAHVAANAIQQSNLFPNIPEQIRGDLSTIVLELGTNIVKYAGHGKILLRSLRFQGKQAIEILAVDDGPGIPDQQQALRDHFSTGNTLGLGLGVVQRLCDSFELQSTNSGGTRARALRWIDPSHQRKLPPEIAARSPATQAESRQPRQILTFESKSKIRPALHQSKSGDAIFLANHGHLAFRILLDGAGHGPLAHMLSQKASHAIQKNLEQEYSDLQNQFDHDSKISRNEIQALMMTVMTKVHEQIRGSRGVAMGMAVFDGRERELYFLGIGNTRMMQLKLKGWEGLSRDGQLGVNFKNPKISHYQLSAGDIFIQCSDGIRTSTLRAIRPTRSNARINPDEIIQTLMTRTGFSDDVSILITQCHD